LITIEVERALSESGTFKFIKDFTLFSLRIFRDVGFLLKPYSTFQILIAFLLGLFVVSFVLWYSYALPIVIANACGIDSFFKGFKAALSVFNERCFKFSFTKKYFRWRILWTLAFNIFHYFASCSSKDWNRNSHYLTLSLLVCFLLGGVGLFCEEGSKGM